MCGSAENLSFYYLGSGSRRGATSGNHASTRDSGLGADTFLSPVPPFLLFLLLSSLPSIYFLLIPFPFHSSLFPTTHSPYFSVLSFLWLLFISGLLICFSWWFIYLLFSVWNHYQNDSSFSYEFLLIFFFWITHTYFSWTRFLDSYIMSQPLFCGLRFWGLGDGKNHLLEN